VRTPGHDGADRAPPRALISRPRLTAILGRATICLAVWLAISPTARADGEFRIGLPMELSGRFVAFGSQIKRGVETAVETWKQVRGDKVAGRDIVLIERDTQSNNTTTVSVMGQLINSDKADILIGPGGSDSGAAAVPPWKQAADRPVWIVPGVSATVVEKQIGKDPYFFHTFPWTYHYHATIVAGLKQALGTGKKVAIVYSDGAYGRAHIEYARKYLKDGGYDIVDEELIRENAPDFLPSLLKVRAAHPDILYTLVQTSDAVLLAKQIYSAKLNIPYLIGTFQATLPEFKNALGDVQNCWTGVNTYVVGLHSKADATEPKLFPASDEWEAAWRAKYNKEPEYMEVGSYISAMLALLAVEQANATDRDHVGAVLAAEAHDTIMGNSRFEPSEIALHQAFGTVVDFQLQKQGDTYASVIFYPPARANGKLQACPAQ
jgi:branched-chain amino acid transport system substrate-binding protein